MCGGVRLYREALAELLRQRAEIDLVAVYVDIAEAVPLLPVAAPDVVLVDGTEPDSLAAVVTLVSAAPHARTVTLALPDAEEDVLAYAEAGVSGYVARDSSVDDLVSVLTSTVRGEMLCSPRIAGSLVRRVALLASQHALSNTAARLTRREREVVRLIDEGLSNKQIAQRLSIELATVKNHVHNILEKLGVERRAEAAAALRSARI